MSTLSARIASLPRAAKWLLALVAVVVGYFAMVEPGLNFLGTIRSKAQRIESDVRRDGELSDPSSEDGRLLALGRQNFGAPLPPGEKSNSAETLYRVVDRILKEHGIEDAAINERSSQLRSDYLGTVLGDSGKVNRFILEVTFESDTQGALDVLAELEQAPEVSAVSKVRFDKLSVRSASADKADMVRVTLAPEAWLSAGIETGGTP